MCEVNLWDADNGKLWDTGDENLWDALGCVR